MNYQIQIISQDAIVEESLWIHLYGHILNVFSSENHLNLKPLEVYEVELEFQIFNEYQVVESNLEPQLRKIDESFSYEVIGLLENGVITVGDFKIFDEILLSDYGYLDGRNVSWIVDRIDMSID